MKQIVIIKQILISVIIVLVLLIGAKITMFPSTATSEIPVAPATAPAPTPAAEVTPVASTRRKGDNSPRCFSCDNTTYSTEYCEDCGKWMNPPYCPKCKRSFFNHPKPDKFCDSDGTKLIILKEPK